MRGEDTILGTALARAIESQPIRSTPFERSRVAVHMAGGGRSPLVPVLAAAAAVVLGLALGAALFGQRGGDPGGVAASPTPSPDASASPGASPSASPTATPEGDERIWVYFAQDQLPPVGAYVRGTFRDGTAQERIASRLVELRGSGASEVPSGATNTVSQLGGDGAFKVDVTVQGDLATVDFPSGAFSRIRGSAMTQALIQQLVYTITEEPGIRRALIREAGKNAEIDQEVIDAPRTREDVLPYQGVRTEERIALEDDPRPSTLTTRLEQLTGGARFVIEMKATQTPEGSFWSPRLSAELRPNANEQSAPGKWHLVISVGGGVDGTTGDKVTDSSPLRAVRTAASPNAAGTTYMLALDDARPWRVSLEPGSAGTMRVLVDIGGHPRAISDSVAVYGPKPGDEVSRTFTLAGAARAFEASVSWRLKDANQREVATGFATASQGTSPVWGTFTTGVKVPDNVSGAVTLEVFWGSPRDGADVGRVAIPLRIR